MENKFYVNHVVSQLESLLSLGEQVEEAESVQGVLYNSLNRIRSLIDSGAGLQGQPLPRTDGPRAANDALEGYLNQFPHEEIVEFGTTNDETGVPIVREGQAVVTVETDEETGEEQVTSFVGGYGKDAETGEMVELPGTTEAIAETNRMLREAEEEEGEPLVETDGLLRITYKREDEAELTEEHVINIVNSPISAGLQKFGALQLMAIEDGDTPAAKVAVFSPTETSATDLDFAALAVGLVRYGGTVVFPNIGLVSAEAKVNAEWRA